MYTIPLVQNDAMHRLGSPIKFNFANKDDLVIETSRIPRPAPRRLSLPSTHLRLLPPPVPMNQSGANGARQAKGMNSFAKGDIPPPSGPPNVPPPPIPGNRRADTPAVLQHQQQQQSKPSSPRRPATDLKFYPPSGGGAPVNPPPHPPIDQRRIGQLVPPSYPPPAQPIAPSYPPPAQPTAPLYPPPAPPAHYGQNGGGQTSPIRRPRADSDAATSKLTEGFTASSDADMSYYPVPRPVPEKHNDKREIEFRESLWRNSMPANKPSNRTVPDANVFIGADGMMGTGNTVPISNNMRERLGDQREQYYSEPNMGHATNRRTRHMLPLGRSNSHREKILRDDGEARASSPTLRDMGKTKHHLEHRHSADVEYPSRDMRGANDMERDFAGEDSDASANTTQQPVKIIRHGHRQPTDSPQRSSKQHQHQPHQSSRQKLPELQSSRKRNRLACDYEDEALANMSYTTLRDQDFDVDPAQAVKSSRTASHEALDLPAKLAHFHDTSADQQLDFFCNMPLADWEASGDWFMDQFAGVMQRLRESRQLRRQVISEFEGEIAEREEAVRGKTDSIDRKLRRMHHNGLKIMSD